MEGIAHHVGGCSRPFRAAAQAHRPCHLRVAVGLPDRRGGEFLLRSKERGTSISGSSMYRADKRRLRLWASSGACQRRAFSSNGLPALAVCVLDSAVGNARAAARSQPGVFRRGLRGSVDVFGVPTRLNVPIHHGD